MILMDEKPYNEISVSDIVEKAGIARQTFYRSYNNKDDVILQFFEEHFKLHLVKIANTFHEGKRDTFELTLPLGRVIKYADIFKKILNSDAEHLCYASARKNKKTINDLYGEKVPKDIQIIFGYIINYRNYGATRLICDWIKDGMPIPVEMVTELIRQMVIPFDIAEFAALGAALPQIVLNIEIEE